MNKKDRLRILLAENYALLAILIGAILISVSIAPLQTLDTQLEFDTTKSILRVGWPILPSTGEILNEPPLGFYTAALFFKVFPFTINNGTNLVTLFGLGCIVALYFIGKEFYGKSAGLFAAAFFALAPWELVLSRAFLIDTQCLFLSLISLYFGIKAIRKNSSKLALVSGVFFAASLLTKLYAAFILIPLLLMYVHYRPKKPKQILSQLAAFSIPAIYANFLWYQIFLKEDLIAYIFYHNDFRDLNSNNAAPSYTFLSNFLINYGIGSLFVAAVAFSLIISLFYVKHLPKKFAVFDLICFATLLSILGVNMYLGVNLNLKAPYTSAIKFSYQSLPYFSLVAGSLAAKSVLLFDHTKQAVKIKKALTVLVVFIGVFFLIGPLLVNMHNAHKLSMASYIVFQVQPGQDLGYSFYIEHPTSPGSSLMTIQFLGFLFVFSGLLWNSRHFISAQLKSISSRIESQKVAHFQD
jgi:4-amino-4-deoxy-L-arabinose transferase-like glycosyltransferase